MKWKTNSDIVERIHDFRMSETPGDESQGRISGYAAVYDTEYVYHMRTADDKVIKVTETIARGAFTDELIRTSDVKATINHSDNIVPIARCKFGEGTMTLRADDTGLFFSFVPNPEMKREVAAVKRGDIDQCSYKYIPDVEEVTKAGDNHVRVTVRSFKTLKDICLATYPAYAETSARYQERTAQQILEAAQPEREESDEAARRAAEERRRQIQIAEYTV